MIDAIVDGLIDTLKLIPFLLVTFLLLELWYKRADVFQRLIEFILVRTATT